MLSVDRWGREQALARASAVYRVYEAVFGDASSERAWRQTTYERHVNREAFRMSVALDDERVVGFGYGYVGRPGQFWTDKVAAALPESVARQWVGGHFELVELAVLPEFRGLGLGARLHDDVLDDAPAERALLSTEDDDSPAVRLYRSRGWATLGRLSDGVQVMGLLLRR